MCHRLKYSTSIKILGSPQSALILQEAKQMSTVVSAGKKMDGYLCNKVKDSNIAGESLSSIGLNCMYSGLDVAVTKTILNLMTCSIFIQRTL